MKKTSNAGCRAKKDISQEFTVKGHKYESKLTKLKRGVKCHLHEIYGELKFPEEQQSPGIFCKILCQITCFIHPVSQCASVSICLL